MFTSRGESEVEVAVQTVQWPPALSSLPSQVADMAVDNSGALWFPVLELADDGAAQSNLLYKYDSTTGITRTIPLPGEVGSPFLGRIEMGRGGRDGKVVVAWENTLVEVDPRSGDVHRLSLRTDVTKVVSHGQPPTTYIHDIAVDHEGTIWVTRDHYPYLIAIHADGSAKEFPLPDGAGTPELLAVDGAGRIWATLIRHRPFRDSPQAPPVNAYRIALRFDPTSAQPEVVSVGAWKIAGQGGKVVAMTGEGAVLRLDVARSPPPTITDFGISSVEAQLAVGPQGDVWYYGASLPGLVRERSGSLTAFDLSSEVFSRDSTFGGGLCIDCTRPQGDPKFNISPLALVGAPDGSAWFSIGNQIGHAVP
jgi:streptogramin lyase